MKKTDITQTNLYIKNVINVIKASNKNQHKLLHINERHSDAFVYIISGSCRYVFDDGQEFVANTGDVIYLAHKAVYTMYIFSPNYQFIFCDFEFSLNKKCKSAIYQPKKSVENLFYKLLSFNAQAQGYAFTETLSTLYKIYSAITLSNQEAATTALKIYQAKEFIDQNYADVNLSVSMLAEKTDLSEVYLRKLFKQEFLDTPSQYITSVRLEKAKSLMKYPFLTLEDCAKQSGFSSVQYFCRVFKASTGISPNKFRKHV